jgi:hypothetical protein
MLFCTLSNVQILVILVFFIKSVEILAIPNN